jgi:hypothetical protein
MPGDRLYQRNPSFIYRKIVDEVVLVPIYQDLADMDCIYTLNEVGAFLWEQLEKPVSQSDLQARILDEYEAEPDVLTADMESFLSEMVTIGAVEEV